MTYAPVADLKARLSRYLRRVKSGHEVVITERGLAVAKLVPLPRDHQRAGRRDRLARTGALQPGRGQVRKALRTPPKGKPTGLSVLTALLAERKEGR